MQIRFDARKSRVVKRKHGISLEEALEIFDQAHIIDRRKDDPEQFRAIGWSEGLLCSVVFEVRRDSEGEYCYLITTWKATRQEEQDYAENV